LRHGVDQLHRRYLGLAGSPSGRADQPT